jgi:general secretion pathway protein J
MSRNVADRSSAGFTLVELLVAMALLGLLTALLFAGLRMTAQTAARGTTVLDRTDDLAFAVTFVRSTLADAQPMPEGQPDDHGSALAFDGRSDRVMLIGELPPHAARDGLYRLEILFDRPRRRLTAQWTSLATTDKSAVTSALPMSVLLDRVARVAFGYFGARDNDAVAAWHRAWEGQAELPQLVRVRIGFSDGSQAPDLIAAVRTSAQGAQ